MKREKYIAEEDCRKAALMMFIISTPGITNEAAGRVASPVDFTEHGDYAPPPGAYAQQGKSPLVTTLNSGYGGQGASAIVT